MNIDFKFDVNAVLKELAKGLNTTVDYVYPILMKQAMVDAVAMLLGLLLSILVATVLTVLRKKVKSNYEEEKQYRSWESTEMSVILLMITIVSWIAVGVMSIVCITDVPTMLLNPEYYIVEKLIDTFSQM